MSTKRRREISGESQFQVASILDKRLVGGRYEYLVKHRGSTTFEYQSWEVAGSLNNCDFERNLLREFERNWASNHSHAEQSAHSQNVRKRKRSCASATPQKSDRISDIISRIVEIDSARASLSESSPTKRGRHSLETTASSPESTSYSGRLLSSTSNDPLEEEVDQARFFRDVSSRRTSTPLPPAHDDGSSSDASEVRYLIQNGERVRDVLGLCLKSSFPQAIVGYDCNKTEVVPTSLLSRYQPEVLLRYYKRLDYL